MSSLEAMLNSGLQDNSGGERSLASFTALDRTAWHGAREGLLSRGDTRELIAAVESSLFVVCLDGRVIDGSLDQGLDSIHFESSRKTSRKPNLDRRHIPTSHILEILKFFLI